MAKAKSKPAAGKAKTPVLAAQLKSKPHKLNPFELKGSKGHFDTIGRRHSGKKKSVIVARQEAVNRRKETLLVEYRHLRKANTFIDRRFGEADSELTEADKGLARLQAQRVKEARVKQKRASKFTLSEDGSGGNGLTHLGRSLADDIRNFMDQPEFDDLDGELVEDLVAQYHFGGGNGNVEGEEQGAGEGQVAARGLDGKPKTRKQVMEEIIAKSRMYRAIKAKQREEDDAALEAINQEFKELVSSAALKRLFKAPREDKGLKSKADNPDDAAYDVAARELAFESKGAAGERTLSPEELLEKERQRLEKLEKERLQRMRGGRDEDGEEDEEEGEDDGQRKRRRHMPSADALGDEFDSEEGKGDESPSVSEDQAFAGLSGLDKRRMKAAAGNHPLQESFRAAAAALADKYGMEVPKNPFIDEDEGEDVEEGEEEEGEEEGSDEGENQDDAVASSNDESEDAGEENRNKQGQVVQRQDPTRVSSASSLGDDGGGDAKAKKIPTAVVAKPLDEPLDLPYTIPLPSSYSEFVRLVLGRGAEDLHTAISRIRAFNAVALATDHKRKMQEFYGILVQHFATEAGKSPLPMDSLDVLTRVILEVTSEVPYYAATVARTRIGRISDQLTAALSGTMAREAADAALPVHSTSSWPTARVLLQLKLFTLLFPRSDRRHPVLTPAALLIGKCLSQCVVGCPYDAAIGLCMCGLMTHMAAPAQRTTPEVLVFLRDCLAAFMPAGFSALEVLTPKDNGSAAASSGGNSKSFAPQHHERFERFTPGLLALSGREVAHLHAEPLNLYDVLGMSKSNPWAISDEFKLGLLRVAFCCVRRVASLAAEARLVCFEQMFAPLSSVMLELRRIDSHLPEELRTLRLSIVDQLTEASASCVASRRPLVHAARAHAGTLAGVILSAQVRQFNPRFEEGFSTGRDYDPDRQRVEQRRLKRALVKERRGAIRELRRDAVFMADERDRETARVDSERLESQRKFYSELQRQEADMRSGGQGGMNPHLKKKAGKRSK